MPTRLQIAGFIFAFVGVALVITQGKGMFAFSYSIGELLALTATFCQVLYTLTLKKSSEHLSPILLTATIGLSSALFALPVCFATGSFSLVARCGAKEWALLVLTAIFCRSIGLFLYTTSVKKIGPALTSLLGFSTLPIFVCILSVVLLQEKLTGWHFAGAALVVSSLYLALFSDHRERKRRLKKLQEEL